MIKIFVEVDIGGNFTFGEIEEKIVKYSGVKVGPWYNDVISDVTMGSLKILTKKEEQEDSIEKERQQRILQIALALKEVQEKTEWAISKINGKEMVESNDSKTGIFVVVGVYSGNGSHKPYISAIESTLGRDPNNLNKELKEKYPNGFGIIPNYSTKLPSTSGGSLVTYLCYELTKKGVDLIDWKLEKI